MAWKKWLPAYLWYSGILMQMFLVILGIHALLSAADRRPAHSLHKRLFEQLGEQEFCNQTFRGLEFDWKESKSFKADVSSNHARIDELVYTNRGSLGRTPDGYHVYRIELKAKVRDLVTGEVIQFPARNERLVEVDPRNQIVACHPEMNARNLSVDKMQTIRTQTCEKPGWKRRALCDAGTERCYPMTLCEKRA